jgi:ribosomal protein S18 acetylase RimI-like enzyme
VTPFESAVRGSLEGSRGGRVLVHEHAGNDLDYRATPLCGTQLSPDALTAYLRSLPGDPRLFAAVDQDGVVRGTSGSRTFGSDAYAFFVNTDPGWRRRGIGLAMTAAALRSSWRRGATRASLDASDSGAALYRRLRFTAVAQITQFSCPR